MWEGIYIGESSNNNNLTGNNASNNHILGHGITVSFSNYNTLTGNNASNNYYSGILIGFYSNNNNLTGNIASNNHYRGILLLSSSSNTLTGNNASNNAIGIDLVGSPYNTLAGNTANSNNRYGIWFWYDSSYNILTGNNASNNYDIGIWLVVGASNNTIYNNYFSNTNNAQDDGYNIWNTAKQAGTNIIGGIWLGGNFWANPSGTGFSQTCPDSDGDGICDSAYTLAGGNVDYLPLSLGEKHNTPIGSNVLVNPHPNVSVTFSQVTVTGDTTVTVNTTNPRSDKSGFKFLGIYYDIKTTTTYIGPVTVCLKYDDSGMALGREQALKIFHWNGTDWVNVTLSLDTTSNVICGIVPSLSWFGVTYAITPQVGSITAPIDPVTVNTTITASASFTDPSAMDTHSALWNWGDGTTSAGTITEMISSGSVTGSHTYYITGVYTIILTVTNKDGGTGYTEYRYLVIYDPNGGYVTGGGWVNSPSGAYLYDTTLTGRADFGFISKYAKGATIPTGVTEFQFRAANLNFRSNSYEWLVVAGARVQYKGTGMINGAGNYGFMLTAIDGAINGGSGTDKFRIKIWDRNNNDAVVYDNQLGADDSAEPATVIQGGSIVIHADYSG